MAARFDSSWTQRLTNVLYVDCVLPLLVNHLEMWIGNVNCGTLGAITHYSWEWMMGNEMGKGSTQCLLGFWNRPEKKKNTEEQGRVGNLRVTWLHIVHIPYPSIPPKTSREIPAASFLAMKVQNILEHQITFWNISTWNGFQYWVGQALPSVTPAVVIQFCSLQQI